MEIKPLTQRQLLTMKRANIEVKVKKFWEATKNVDLVTEYIVALIVRNALVVSDFLCLVQKWSKNCFFMQNQVMS